MNYIKSSISNFINIYNALFFIFIFRFITKVINLIKIIRISK